jgi:hypothetical protein
VFKELALSQCCRQIERGLRLTESEDVTLLIHNLVYICIFSDLRCLSQPSYPDLITARILSEQYTNYVGTICLIFSTLLFIAP